MSLPLTGIPDLKVDESFDDTIDENKPSLYTQSNGSNTSFTHTNAYRYSRSRSPKRTSSPIRKGSPVRNQPFKFGSITMNNSSDNLSLNPAPLTPNSGPKASYRRGHRYKHSSVSMNMFQEPPKRTSVPVPQQYTLPTVQDTVRSLGLHEKLKLAYCTFHILLSLVTYLLGFHYGNVCLSTLSHLVLYDSIGSLMTLAVQIMTNFEIWSHSSLKYPFGLGRIEVLAGFGLSVSLLFVGVDLFSHLFESFMLALAIGDVDETMHAHHVHKEKGLMNIVFYETYLLAVCITTFASPRVIGRPKKIVEQPRPRPKRVSSITLQEEPVLDIKTELKKTQNQLTNYTSVLSFGYALFAMLYPLVAHTELVSTVNEVSSLALAAMVLTFAWKLISRLAGILLLRNPQPDIDAKIVDQIQSLEVYKSSYKISELKVAKVNHKIVVVILNVQMIGASDDDESKLRFYATRIVRGLLSQTDTDTLDLDADFDSIDQSGDQFEITIQVDRV